MLNPTSYQGIVNKNKNEISLHTSRMAKIITTTTIQSVDEAVEKLNSWGWDSKIFLLNI